MASQTQTDQNHHELAKSITGNSLTTMQMCRARDAVAKEKALAAEAKVQEEEMQANMSKLQKQIDKATAERNAAEGRSQRSASSLAKSRADLSALEIKFQVHSLLQNQESQGHAQHCQQLAAYSLVLE